MKKRLSLFLAVVITTVLLSSCGIISSGNKETVVINEKTLDIAVTAQKAHELGQTLLDSVPSLKTLRTKYATETGKNVILNISVQSSPDTEGMNDIEKNNYFMYVAYSDPGSLFKSGGLLHTFTFLINKDDNSIKVFDENGDDTITVAQWNKNVGVG